MFENMATVAAAVAWELVGLPEAVQARELKRLKAENPAFHSLVADHMATLRET